jgi:hypothetical protein
MTYIGTMAPEAQCETRRESVTVSAPAKSSSDIPPIELPTVFASAYPVS